MTDRNESLDKFLEALKERAKELNCLYAIEELLGKPEKEIEDICTGIVRAIPPGWQYPEICRAMITLHDRTYRSPDFDESPWVQCADIVVRDVIVGAISVYYKREMPPADIGPFLKEEQKLIETIADRVGHFLIHEKMKHLIHEWRTAKKDLSEHRKKDWEVVLDLLRQTDNNLFIRISSKMLNHLCWSGIEKAEEIRQSFNPVARTRDISGSEDENRPLSRSTLSLSPEIGLKIFRIAGEFLSDAEILSRIQRWIQEDKLSALIQVVHRHLPLPEVVDALRRFHHQSPGGVDNGYPASIGVKVSLIRRILSDQLRYLNVIKDFIEIDDLYHLLQKAIFSPESHGQLGGKSAGLFLATQILKKSKGLEDELQNLKIPKTWYITSDMMLHFMHFNNFDEIVEQKYKDINRVRLEYPNIVQTFTNSHFPPELVKGLSVALDEFKDVPLIVRSSSLLEDRMGAAFFGKYKSLFLANQGTKAERLEALLTAVAEVYSSIFGPDPIKYRAARGLLDFREEMGIMIQEVVGCRVGKYYMPTYSGVALSRNEFRWSPRIRREDGLIRIVPGLGTRAVDRTCDDYPVLIAPGRPGLRVNVTVEETVRYAPKEIDVINLETNTFETVEIKKLLRNYGDQYPGVEQIVSMYDQDHARAPAGFGIDFEKDDLVVTFDGLVSQSPLVHQIRTILKLLEEVLETPVDIEFASDGKDFYLLQCRPQSYAGYSSPAPIPKDIPKDRIVFSANRYVSNGKVPNITHIVYVDPNRYGMITEMDRLQQVGRAIGKLNEVLPKRQFILMGPGRWGSRGDIKLGVKVTYSDINNTAVLIEIARQKGNYVPDLSFGTHFFQDLVESEIRYLPLYPDDEGIIFNERLLQGTPNILSDILPEFAHLSETLKLIDVPKATNGKVLQVLMNADLDEAIGILAEPKADIGQLVPRETVASGVSENYWRWRLSMAEHLAAMLDPDRYGVASFYVFGSTKNATAGPSSDIDLLVHFRGSERQRRELDTWLDGWSLCLDEMNYLQTGYRSGGLLDVHYVTDEDIAGKTSFAMKINAVTDAARPLEMKK